MRGMRHVVHFTDDDETSADQATAAVLEGLAHDETLLVAANRHMQERLRSRVGDALDETILVDAEDLYRGPATAMQGLTDHLLEELRNGMTRGRAIALPCIEPETHWDWIRYEAAVNELFADFPVTGICFYEAPSLSDEVRLALEEAHPELGCPADRSAPSQPPRAVADRIPVRRLHPLRPPDLLFRDVTEARPVREVGTEVAPGSRAADCAMVVHELTSVAIRSGEPRPDVSLWWSPGELVVRVTGSRAFRDPFAGLRPPQLGGDAGLWIAGQLADDFSVEPSGLEPAITVRFRHR